MRRSKPLLAVATGLALFSLAACGGSGNGKNADSTDNPTFIQDQAGKDKDPSRQGPAPDIEGAKAGGTLTVYLPGDPGPQSGLDPTDGWSVTGNSIQQALVNRSLTQFARDDSGKMILVPDLAVDLGTPNEDYTEWTFQLRDDATWETGDPVTAEEVAFGITRSLDSTAFPGGPGTEYSVNYFKGAAKYKGPYTDKGKKYKGVTFDNDANTVTIKMSKPFPDMDYWGAFMAMGPAPLGKTSNPPAYGKHPQATGPYKIESFRTGEELVLVKNDQWNPDSDPARHQYADSWVFKFNADQGQTDEIMLSGNTESQTALSTGLGADNYAKAADQLGDRLLQESTQCTSFWAPDYTKIKEKEVREALGYAYPYEDVWTATGELPGVTRVHATSAMPPGMAGKPDYSDFVYDPEKAKELLKQAGYEPGDYQITMLYSEEKLAQAGFKQIQKGLTESGFKVKGIPIGETESSYSYWLDPNNKVNKQLNLRGVAWCADWPSGSTFVPAMFRGGATYNTAHFADDAIDQAMDDIATMPLEEQADAWGALDEKIGTEFLPMIPLANYNNLFTFGEKVGNPTGDEAMGAPNYKDLYVIQ